MSTQPTQSHACCTVPPATVAAGAYQPRGAFSTVAGMKTYHTGPPAATVGLLVVYDIFGFAPQTLQGADILATGDADKPRQVFMPDFFDGEPADPTWYPPDTDGKRAQLQAFFGAQAAPAKTLARIPGVLRALEAAHGVRSWGIVGFCWGGKMANLCAGQTEAAMPFRCAASCHPAMVEAADAAALRVPFALLASGDEAREEVAAWEKRAAGGPACLVRWWPEARHGFMAARADLEDEAVRRDYAAGYGVLLEWFREHL